MKRTDKLDPFFHVTGCPTGKFGHATRRDAKAHALRLRVTGDHLRPYLCDQCGLWHVGHLPGAVIRGARDATEHYKHAVDHPSPKRGPQ